MAFTLKSRTAGVILALAASGSARADIYTVGPTSAGCGFATIQQAIDRAQTHAGPDTVRITRAANHTQQAVTVNATEDLNIVGGFADCTSAATDEIHTTINGSGGAQAPVFRIAVANGVRVKLRHLDITGGDSSDYGGGIYFIGGGTLEIMELGVIGNRAAYGGGIYAKGTGASTRLEIGPDVLVAVNQVTASGGGIYADSITMTMTEPGSAIFSNQAPSGWGGGLKVLGDAYPGRAWLSSGGPAAFGYATLSNNVAKYGGGLAIEGRNGESGKVYLYTTDPNRPAAISGNQAVENGGGVYAEPGPASAEAVLLAWNANIEHNLAISGAAVHLGKSESSAAAARFNFNSAATDGPVEPAPSGSVRCNAGVACNRIHSNKSDQENTAAILAQGRSSFALRGVSLRDNEVSRVFEVHRDTGAGSALSVISDSLVADNRGWNALSAWGEGRPPVRIDGVTIAGNTWPGGAVLSSSGDLELKHSLIWQPGKPTLDLRSGAGTIDAKHVLASEIASLGADPTIVDAAPRFLDAAHGDYRLHAASPAVDFADGYVGTDLTGMPRGKDLDTPDMFGPSDLGAYERQGLAPLVYDGHFDAQLNGWTVPDPANIAWSSENAPDSAGGSALIDAVLADGSVSWTGAWQCVFLPAPGSYVLHGSGRAADEGQAQADTVRLDWGFRRNGGAGCLSGVPDRSGDLVLSTAPQWLGESTTIDVPPGEWTADSSIVVHLKVLDRGTASPHRAKGWFDGIALDYVPLVDEIFGNGFESVGRAGEETSRPPPHEWTRGQ